MEMKELLELARRAKMLKNMAENGGVPPIPCGEVKKPSEGNDAVKRIPVKRSRLVPITEAAAKVLVFRLKVNAVPAEKTEHRDFVKTAGGKLLRRDYSAEPVKPQIKQLQERKICGAVFNTELQRKREIFKNNLPCGVKREEDKETKKFYSFIRRTFRYDPYTDTGIDYNIRLDGDEEEEELEKGEVRTSGSSNKRPRLY